MLSSERAPHLHLGAAPAVLAPADELLTVSASAASYPHYAVDIHRNADLRSSEAQAAPLCSVLNNKCR